MIKKIILTVVAVVVVICTIIVVNINETNDITVSIEIVYNEEIKKTELFIPEDSSFIIELNKEFDLDIRDGFLYKIDFLDLNGISNAYIAFYVNDEYSRYGLANMKLNDNDKVSFIYTLL